MHPSKTHVFLLLTVASSLLVILGLGVASERREPAPMRNEAERASQRPLKLDVQPSVQSARVGDSVSVNVLMLDANNKQTSWNRQCEVEVDAVGESGGSRIYKLTIPPGQSVGQLTVEASQVGLLTLKAHETNNTLLSGGNSLLVTPLAASKKAAKKKLSGFQYSPADSRGKLVQISGEIGDFPISRVSIVHAHGVLQTESASVTDVSAPGLMLANSGGKDEILADGKDPARIRIYFVDPQGGSAPADIKVWLSWSNGHLEPQPLVIKKGRSAATAEWTSLSPVTASVSVVNSAPKYPVEGNRTIHVSFVPAIYGIAPSSANPLRMCLIDYEPVVAQFFDASGRTVQTDKPRHVTFISSNSSLHIDPDSLDVPKDGSAATVYLLPTWSGTSRLDIWTPGYDHQTLEVDVSVWLVLLLCLSGGVIGGVAAKEALKGAITWRIFVGVLGSIVLVWICVYAVLPKTHSVIAHNLVSVFVVGILGGYGGTRVLDFAGKKLGYL